MQSSYLLVFVIVMILAGGLFYYQSHVKGNCRTSSCSGFNLKCEVGEPVTCLAVYMPGDVCRKFVSCKASGLSCDAVVSEHYRQCTDCFESCMNAVAADNCSSICDQKFRSDIYPDIRE